MPKVKTDKEKLLRKSSAIFHQKGYYNTTFGDLSAACDIEKPHFFYYFKDKKDLMSQVLLFAHEEIKKTIFLHAYNDELTGFDKVDKISKNILKLNMKYPYGCLMGNTVLETISNEPAFQRILQDYFNDFINALSEIYKTRYDEEVAVSLASEDVRQIQGSILFMRLFKNSLFLEEALGKIKKRIT